VTVGDEEEFVDSGTDAPGGDGGRLRLYAYLARQETRTYVAIMRLFTSTLLADLSAADVAAALVDAEAEGRIDPGEAHIDRVLVRLDQLLKWGNLVRGRRETNTRSITEFLYGSWRYQVTKLAVRVQRDVEAMLAVPEGAREVTRELLPAISRGLERITQAFAQAVAVEATRRADSAAARQARERLAELVTTVFLQQGELAATVRDFYAYLGQVVARYDLDPNEIAGFRGLLVEYIQMVVDDVLRFSPQIERSLAVLRSNRAELLRLLEAREVLGEQVERAGGRSADDWVAFTSWFVDQTGRRSQVYELRQATSRAIGALLANVRRSSAGAVIAPSRRLDLLRLARVFDQCSQEKAHAVYAAVFGMYSARHLLVEGEPDAAERAVPWRDATAVRVLVSVAERPERAAQGKSARIHRDPLGEQLALREAEERAQARRLALAELAAAADDLEGVVLTPAALAVLYELVRAAMSQRSGEQEDGRAGGLAHGVSLILRAAPGQCVRVRSHTGTLTVRESALLLRREATTAGAMGG
jgi:uncharacterized protein (TIGR02677 family)